MLLILGIESSCDETAVALVDEKGNIIKHLLLSQIQKHQVYGGVVPELAARSHLSVIDTLINELFIQSKINPKEVDAFAATCGPGLAGGLIIGSLAAKTLAFVHNKPFIAVNHLVGHALLPTMFHNIAFPFLLLLVSGGHSQFLAVLNYNKYVLLGNTIDDAVGEAFDKSARMLGLPYPGGKKIEELAQSGDANKFTLPKPLYKQKHCNFSFSGLKTAVRNLIEQQIKQINLESSSQLNPMDNNKTIDHAKLSLQTKCDIAATLQKAIADIIADRSTQAINMFQKQYGKLENFVISGGVSANLAIQTSLEQILQPKNINFYAPPINLATDNAVMIAWAALQKHQHGQSDPLNYPIKPRWPLSQIT